MGISLLLKKSDSKKLGGKIVSPIKIKYIYKGNYKRFPTDIFIEEKYWKKGSISSRCPNYVDIQRKLSQKMKQINDVITDIVDDGNIPTADLVKILLESKKDITITKQPKLKGFWQAYEEFLTEKSRFQRGYVKTLYTLKFKLKDFEKKTKHRITFDYILFGKFEKDFNNYCLDVEITNRPDKKNKIVGLSNNYVNKLFTHTKIFLSWCKEEGYISEDKKFKKLKEVKNDILVYLNSDEVRRMYNFKKYDYPNTYLNSVEIKDFDRDGNLILYNNKELIKDMFTFQCSVGSRWSDLEKMKVGMFKIEKGFFTWMMEKTKNIVRVPENPISIGVFKKYSLGKTLNQPLFPSYSLQKFNKHLKGIGKELKFNRLVKREILVGTDIREDSKRNRFTWELLSSHSGRRSFVKNLLDLGTMDNFTIMKLSGHKTIESFQKYVSVINEDIIKGKELYENEIDNFEINKIKKQLDNLSNEELSKYLIERMNK
jgi:integrase